jgi:hypothetical protein
VRFLIQDSSSKQYFTSESKWSGNDFEARDFLTTLGAYNYILGHSLENVNIVLKDDDDPAKDVVLQLSAATLRSKRYE